MINVGTNVHTQHYAAITATQGGNRAHNRHSGTAAATESSAPVTANTDNTKGSLQGNDVSARNDAPAENTKAQHNEQTKKATEPSAVSRVAMFFILRNKRTILMALQNL